MKAWIIEGPTGALLPSACGRTRAEAINNCLGWCDWILFPTWKAMRKDGFKAVKVEIKKLPSNVVIHGPRSGPAGMESSTT